MSMVIMGDGVGNKSSGHKSAGPAHPAHPVAFCQEGKFSGIGGFGWKHGAGKDSI